MINGGRNSWTARKNSHRSQIAIPFAKWRISNMSEMQFWKQHNFREILYPEYFRVADYKSDIGFSKFKMADIIFWEHNDFHGTLYSRTFGVADYKFNIGFPFLEMVDPIWRTWKLYDFRTTLYSGIFGVADYKFQIRFSVFHRLWVDFDEIFCVFPVSPNPFSCSS